MICYYSTTRLLSGKQTVRFGAEMVILHGEEIYIQHARNGGEKSVGSYLLDGYHEETNTAYEVQGCFWHGKLFVLSEMLMCLYYNTL